jgi:hypothetical protein
MKEHHHNVISFLSVSPSHQFLCGLIVLPAFLLQGNLIIRSIQTLLFLILARGSGRKVKVFSSLLILVSVLLMNILSPHGEILIKILSFPVTLDAMLMGLHRATTFIGLIFLSQYAISSRLKFPGVAGGMVGKVFFYFEHMQEENRVCSEKNLFRRIDNVLYAVSSRIKNHKTLHESHENLSTGMPAIIFIATFIVLNWGVLILWFLKYV